MGLIKKTPKQIVLRREGKMTPGEAFLLGYLLLVVPSVILIYIAKKYVVPKFPGY